MQETVIGKALYVPNGYVAVWGDDFDGDTLNTEKWQFTKGMSGYNNLILTANPEVVSVSNSNLNLNTIRYKDETNEEIKYAATYSISTPETMNFKYGYIEMRAKVPYKVGSWPSFWMKATNGPEKKYNFLSDGNCKDYMTEVDIFEVFGDVDTAVSNIHKWYDITKFNKRNCNYNIVKPKVPYIFDNYGNLSNEYHIYGFEWTPEKMLMSINGKVYMTYDLNDNIDVSGIETDMRGFHDPMYILFNNHLTKPEWDVSKNISDNDFPMSYSIDWIYLYQIPGVGELYTKK